MYFVNEQYVLPLLWFIPELISTYGLSKENAFILIQHMQNKSRNLRVASLLFHTNRRTFTEDLIRRSLR